MSRVAFQLLELSLISALDLALPNKNLSKNLKTYAVIWIDPERKLRTRPDLKGNNNPHWNEKFVFRVEDRLLDSDTASVMVEIYAVGWLRDSLVGSVGVLIRDLIPPSARREKRVVALQVRRHHNGRPQGILSMGVVLLDNTMKSMPLFTAAAVASQEFCCGGAGEINQSRLTRTLSDQTDLSRLPGDGKRKRCGSICYGSDATAAGGGSVVNPAFGGGYGSVVNCEASVISDLGPSPSVVAIAIAHGLYPLQQRAAAKGGGSVLEDWTVEAGSTVEDVQARLEQWRLTEHQKGTYRKVGNNGKKRQKKGSIVHRRSKTVGGDGGGDGRFSCFGKVCGCEFTVVYGSGGNKRAKKNWGHGSSASSMCSDQEL